MGNSKRYDLEDRTLKFAKDVRDFLKRVPNTLSNVEYSKQLIKSSGSVGSNYREANEVLGKKDFGMRIKICRKESKESIYWLELVECKKDDEPERLRLTQEATELMKIFGAILEKTKS